MEGKKLRVVDRPPGLGNEAIDYFFTSLGVHCKRKAIAILFWGLGKDGINGIQAIERYGGLVIVQKPDGSDEAQMARAAIELNNPHLVIDISEMENALQTYISNNGTLASV